MTDITIQQWIEQLNDKTSSKRRSAAIKLRKLKAKEAGPALLVALKNELKDQRTWETQYQIIMALGESSYTECLGFLLRLSEQEFEASMILIAIGDAIIRLEKLINQHSKLLYYWLQSDRKHLVEGGIRALAMERIIPEERLINDILRYVESPQNQYIGFWVAAASPEWPKDLTEQFLLKCIESSKLEDTKKAAFAALNGNYLKWNTL